MVTRTPSRSARFTAAALAALLAACGGSSKKSSSTPVTFTVSIVAPDPAYLFIGRHLRLGAVASYSDGSTRNVTTEAVFTSSNPAAIQVTDTTAGGLGGRLVAAGSAGSYAGVTASWGGKTSAPVTVTVQSPAAVGPGVDNDPLLLQQWHLRSSAVVRNGLLQSGFTTVPTDGVTDIHAAGYAYANGYSGYGVKVAVVDSGLELAHEDFYYYDASWQPVATNLVAGSWNFTNRTADPTTTRTTGDHGTSVAGLIAAANGNGLGGMGVAPSASLNGYNLLDRDTNQTTANYVAALGGGTGGSGPTSSDVWIFNQSFGASDTAPIPPDDYAESMYWAGVNGLRGGLGAVYVKSAGNDFGPTKLADGSIDPNTVCTADPVALSCENASMDPNNTLPPNIVVGAVNAGGFKSSYSTAGSAVWIAGLGGEYGGTASCAPGCDASFFQPAMVTVDQSGCGAGYSPLGPYSSPLSGFNGAGGAGGPGYFDQYLGATVNQHCNYTNTFNGTSSAAPVVSGVVALMLEANPSLTWRDVKVILASTARPLDGGLGAVRVLLSDATWDAEPAWTTNHATPKLWFHNWYGFGLVDADAAVQAAEGWAPGALGTLQSTGWRPATVDRSTITPDSLASAGRGTVSIPAGIGFIEAVQVQVRTDHRYPGYLGIELTSPSGTRSVLLNPFNAFQENNPPAVQLIQLASNMFLGEAAAGTWTLRVVNASNGGTGSLNGWSIRIYGH